MAVLKSLLDIMPLLVLLSVLCVQVLPLETKSLIANYALELDTVPSTETVPKLPKATFLLPVLKTV